MISLTVTLADLEGIPHASPGARTHVEVEAQYTGPVILTDGTIIPPAPKPKPLPPEGEVSFLVYGSDDPAVMPEYQGFAVRVVVWVSRSGEPAKRFERTVKPLGTSGTVGLGDLPSAEGLPPRFVSVQDFAGVLEEQANVLASQRGWLALRMALATGTARVVAMGDSKTEGAGVPTVDERWLNLLMASLRARYAPTGDQGLGYLPAYYATFWGFPSAPVTSGSVIEVGYGGGLGNRSLHLEAGASVTWTVPAWTDGVPLIVHWTQHPNHGDLEVVTGGTVRATITTGGTSVVPKTTTVTVPAGTTSVTVRHKAGTGNGAARVEAIVHRTKTEGVIVYDAGKSGGKAVDYAEGLPANTDSDDQHWQAVASVAPHCVILAFGANDQASRTAEQWRDDLTTCVAKAKAASPGCGVVILHGAQRTEDVVSDPTRIRQFEQAAREAVGHDPDVHIMYESSLWAPRPGVDYTSGDPSGWLSDTVHTSPAANALIARFLDRAID